MCEIARADATAVAALNPDGMRGRSQDRYLTRPRAGRDLAKTERSRSVGEAHPGRGRGEKHRDDPVGNGTGS